MSDFKAYYQYTPFFDFAEAPLTYYLRNTAQPEYGMVGLRMWIQYEGTKMHDIRERARELLDIEGIELAWAFHYEGRITFDVKPKFSSPMCAHALESIAVQRFLQAIREARDAQ